MNGYNLAIDQAGRVWMLRSTTWRGNRIGAHCASASNPDANEEYVGVLLILGADEVPSTDMRQAVATWYEDKFLNGWKGRTDIRGHRDVPGARTSCPGENVLTYLADGIREAGDDDDSDSEPAPDGDAFPGRNAFRLGQRNDHVITLDHRLIAHEFTHHHDGDGYQPGPTYTWYTRMNVADFQFMQGWTGNDADGFPGPVTWQRLMGEPDQPVVDLSQVRHAARRNPWTRGQPVTYDPIRYIEFALVRLGLLHERFADGHFGTKTLYAYRKWQRELGFRGKDADGVPGDTSLTTLGQRFGFQVQE